MICLENNNENEQLEGGNLGVADDNFGQKEDTYRDMLDKKVQSLKSSSSSSNLSVESHSLQSISNTNHNRGPFLPEPLPLFDGPAEDEPNLLQGFRRATKIFKSGSMQDGGIAYCPHEQVSDWVCKECKKRIP